MKKLWICILSFLIVFISCKPEIKIVEKFVEKPAGHLSITITQPNDNGNTINLTNDTAPINIKVSSPDSIRKVVWKKGKENCYIKPAVLLNDSTAKLIALDENSKATFSVTENGWYDIVAEDSMGRYEWEQVEIKTIDKTSPQDVNNYSATYTNGYINISWEEPIEDNTDPYNSPYQKIKISYIYNNNINDIDNGEIFIPKGTRSYSIQRAAGKTVITYLDIKIQTVDEVGNVSSGKSNQVECFETFTTTRSEAIDVIKNITYSAKVIVTGGWGTYLGIKYGNYGTIDYCGAINSKDRKIALDLTELINYSPNEWDKFNSPEFYNCINLTEIRLPSGTGRIVYNSFENCTNLETIYIPSTVNLINCGGFRGTNLTNVIFEDTDTEWRLYYSDSGIHTLIKTINNMSETNYEENANLLLLSDLPSMSYPEYSSYAFCTKDSDLWKEAEKQ